MARATLALHTARASRVASRVLAVKDELVLAVKNLTQL
jgi:hypothetical protein